MNCFKCNQTISENPVYGLHSHCFIDWFNLPEMQEFCDLDPKSSGGSSSASDTGQTSTIKKKKDSFFHGRYLKYSARLGTVDYILKIQEKDFPELPTTEYLCNGIARIIGIDVPDFYLIDFNGRTTFVTKNFMQDYIGTLHHIYKFLPEGDEYHNCSKIIKVILAQTGMPTDVAKFIRICLFDSLIGNNDRHGRNLGIIETAKSKRLAPMYDNPSYLGIVSNDLLEAHFNLSGSIWTDNTEEPKVKDYIEEFCKLGYKKIVLSFCSQIIKRSSKIIESINKSQIEEKRKKAFLKLIKARIGDFENAK
ncbi:MAG: HipA domain-containing protein [Oligoflexia bacterium]|nr:HipA domain-containing protein [Oligoflexia bacterium]